MRHATGTPRSSARSAAIRARRSALAEAKTRLTANREEAAVARGEIEQSLAALPPSTEVEERLAAIRTEIEGHRAHLAEVRAEAQGLAREAEQAVPPAGHDRAPSARAGPPATRGAASQTREPFRSAIEEAKTERAEPGRRAAGCSASSAPR